MAHFAKIEGELILSEFSGSVISPEISGGFVSCVLVVSDEHEADGETFLSDYIGLGGTWIQTSYNTLRGIHTGGKTPLRKNYAGIGYIYDYNRDAFIYPLPKSDPEVSGSWSLNEFEGTWNFIPSGSSVP